MDPKLREIDKRWKENNQMKQEMVEAITKIVQDHPGQTILQIVSSIQQVANYLVNLHISALIGDQQRSQHDLNQWRKDEDKTGC